MSYVGARLRLDVYCGVTKRLLRGIGSTLKEKAGLSFVHVCPRENVNTKQVGPLLYGEIKGVCGRFLAWLAIKWKKYRRSSGVLFGVAAYKMGKKKEGGQTFVMLSCEPPIGAQPS